MCSVIDEEKNGEKRYRLKHLEVYKLYKEIVNRPFVGFD